jgi:hypothetical protein
MGNIYKIISLIVTAVMVLACDTDPTIKMPADPTMPDLNAEVMKSFKVCDKAESTKQLTKDSFANQILLEDRIESKNYEVQNCKGEIIEKGYGPVRIYKKRKEIAAPEDLSQSVTFIEVENKRTCSKYRIYTSANAFLPEEVDLGNGQKIKLPILNTEAQPDGTINLLLTDSIYKFFNATHLANGKNLIQIRYFGNCLDNNRVQKANLQVSHSCETAELIASKDLQIELKIDRPRVDGVEKTSKCSKAD